MSVVEIAKGYIGKTEKPKNSGFKDSEFERKMKDVGFVSGHAWCCYFAELCFKEAYPDKRIDLDVLFSGSTIKTFQNFKKAGYSISDVPFPGALVIWQKYTGGVAQVTGHAGICVSANGDQYETVEGNTTNDPNVREGYIVALKKRVVRQPNIVNGLRVMGFIRIA